MTYRTRFTFLVFLDSIIVFTSFLMSLLLIRSANQFFQIPLLLSFLTLLVGHHFFAFIYKFYKKAWEYASVRELKMIFKAVSFSVLTVAGVQLLFQSFTFRLLVVTWLFYLLLFGGSRLVWRLIRDSYINKPGQKKKTLIIGAGSAGTMVVRQLLSNKNVELSPVAFIDDSPVKQRLDILGVPVVGNVSAIQDVVKNYAIECIVIAIPSLNRKELQRIFQECVKTKVKTQILPMLEDLVTGKVSVNDFRDVQVEDLLGREPVTLDMEAISESITNKVVLVTGAGGSIGSEICRQLLPFHPKRLILLGHGENSIYLIDREMRELTNDREPEIIPIIADLQDARRLHEVMRIHSPNVVYHAAAHKHVPLMEGNPGEAIKNNVIGTKNLAEAASLHGVETFVMVSSDKAVNPTSVMGSTKRMAEMIVQHMDQTSLTRFVAVRFGNVLGSRGSVIPLFKKQIQNGGPVTVTHPDMERYFMTIPEASRLVIQAGALAKGGEIFVLDMGEPVKIVDLAKNLIQLSGHSIDEIGIEFSGVRPGEKLFEELLNPDEVHTDQVYPQIYIGKTSGVFIKDIEELIQRLPELPSEEVRRRALRIANHLMDQPLLSVSG